MFKLLQYSSSACLGDVEFVSELERRVSSVCPTQVQPAGLVNAVFEGYFMQESARRTRS